jgi:hypothetical protein
MISNTKLTSKLSIQVFLKFVQITLINLKWNTQSFFAYCYQSKIFKHQVPSSEKIENVKYIIFYV